MNNKIIKIRVLFFKDGQNWVAQGLEYDMVAQGRTIKETQNMFERVFVGNIIINIENGIEPLSQFKPAPKYFFNMFERAEQLAKKNNKGLIDSFKKFLPSICVPEFQLNDRRIYA